MYPFVVSKLVLAGFVVLPLVLLGLVWWAHRRVTGRFDVKLLAAMVSWFAVTGLVAGTGVLARFDARPPPFLLLLGGVVTVCVVFVKSRAGAALRDGLPLVALVGFQAFRLPLELLMHQAAVEGVMPPQMTFTGWNFDIVTGVGALVVVALKAPRWLVIAWNALGSLLVIAVVTISVLSSPLFKAFGDGAAVNVFVAYVPFVWLPAVMVVLAFSGHALIWQRLYRQGRTSSTQTA